MGEGSVEVRSRSVDRGRGPKSHGRGLSRGAKSFGRSRERAKVAR